MTDQPRPWAVWIGPATGALAVVGLMRVWRGRFELSYEIAAILIPFAFGLVSGLAFGRRERDLAVPMPVAAFVAALATGLLGGGLIVAIVLAAGRQIGGP